MNSTYAEMFYSFFYNWEIYAFKINQFDSHALQLASSTLCQPFMKLIQTQSRQDT